MRKEISRFLLINLGIIIMATGLYLFLIPANLAVGGVTGLAMVIRNFVPAIDLGLLMLIFNMILFIVAFLVIGFSFGSYTIYCSIILSSAISLFDRLIGLHVPLVSDVLLNLIFGILIQGVGMGLIFYQNASTGGTDVLAKIINKFTQLEIGKALFISDALITLLAGMSFGIHLGLYAFLGILINAVIIDQLIISLNSRFQVLIISEQYEKINSYISDELNRGSTFISGFGGYTKQEKHILQVILKRNELKKLSSFIYALDKRAFVITQQVKSVRGEGFTSL